jgi:hypothetical protein
MKRAVVAVATAVLLLVSFAGAAAADPTLDSHGAVSEDRQAFEAELSRSEQIQVENHATVVAIGVVLKQYRRAPRCASESLLALTPLNGPCPDGEEALIPSTCDGDPPVEPLWIRSRADEASSWTPWLPVDAGGCPADVLPVLTEADFQRLPLAPPVLNLQPDRGWVLVNKDTIVTTERTEQTFRTELLGHGIDVVATPDTFTYDFGDDSRDLVTTSAGHPYPNQDTFHVYDRLGTRQITLTTTWKGRYRVDGSAQWRDVVGTAATSATSAPFTVEERRSHLVATLCTDDPRPAGCG